MKFICAILGFILAVAIGFILDEYKIGHGTIFPLLFGGSLGLLAPIVGWAVGTIISEGR